MFTQIDALARDVEEAWASAGHDEARFPEIAAQALSRPLDLDFPTLARRICEGAALPEQRRLDQAFGQPAITLHHGERFVVEALCWHSGSPAIHQHAFSGAFRVLTGRSVHSRYTFAERERLDPRILLGTLRLVGVELLDDSTVVQIPRGPGLIHSAFHLDNPSMTVVVRTYDVSEPEYSYLPPGVAFDPSARSPALHKKLQLLDTLDLSSPALYPECVEAALASSDLYDGMAIVMRAGRHRLDWPTFVALLDRLRDQHGAKIEPLVPALIEERRRSIVVGLRAQITDQDDRFFLAALLGFSRRAELLDAMVQRYGSMEVVRQRVAAGVGRLLGVASQAQVIVDAAVRAMLDDVPPESFPAHAARQWKQTLAPHEVEKLGNFYGQVLQHPLLTPLRADQDG